MTKRSEIVSLFTALGFQPEPHIPHFGEEIVGVAYLRKDLSYVQVIGYDPDYYANLIPRTYAEMRADSPQRTHNGPRVYDGQFCEGIFEVFVAPKITRQPKGKDETKKGERYSEWQKKGVTPILSRTFCSAAEWEEIRQIALDLAAQG